MKKHLVLVGIALSFFVNTRSMATTTFYDCIAYVANQTLDFSVDSDNRTTFEYQGFEISVDANHTCPGMTVTHLSTKASAATEAGNINEYLTTNLKVAGEEALLECAPKK